MTRRTTAATLRRTTASGNLRLPAGTSPRLGPFSMMRSPLSHGGRHRTSIARRGPCMSFWLLTGGSKPSANAKLRLACHRHGMRLPNLRRHDSATRGVGRSSCRTTRLRPESFGRPLPRCPVNSEAGTRPQTLIARLKRFSARRLSSAPFPRGAPSVGAPAPWVQFWAPLYVHRLYPEGERHPG